MKYVNELNDSMDFARKRIDNERAISLAFSEALETLILLVSVGAPHSADEIWEGLGKKGFTYHETWPKFDAEIAKESEVTIAVQVNGKLRDTLQVAAGTDDETIKSMAQKSDKVLIYTEGKQLIKVIVIPGRLVNIVVAG